VPGPAIPRATVRLQLGAGCGFDEAAALVPYLEALGVSHVYASPFLKARAGSAHGYDITDHAQLNPEIGDAAALDRLVEALDARGMGLILDFVPNHMGVGSDNPWWLDVLEWGEASPYAAFFDIDWHPVASTLDGKVLLPVLGDHYGNVLDRGELSLVHEPEAGRFRLAYWEHRFPLRLASYPDLLERARALAPDEGDALDPVVADIRALADSPAASPQEQALVRRDAERVKARLAELAPAGSPLADALARVLAELNGGPGDRASFAALDRILEAQHYRIAYWRVAADEINYRRFFDINDLAGLRVEQPECFEMVHTLVFRLISEGRIQGLRLDHVDGLFDPVGYCAKLQDRIAYLLMQAPAAAPVPLDGVRLARPFWIAVEKILARHERLSPDWPVAGTTGYEFMAGATALLVDPAGEAPMDALYAEICGQRQDYGRILADAKRRAVMNDLVAELTGRATDLYRLAQQSWTSRDHTLTGLRRALVDVAAHFPVYRTYLADGRMSDDDRREVERAVAQAKRRTEALDTSIHDFLRDALTGDLAERPELGYDPAAARDVARRVQQFTGPVMAKAVEDTAFYRYVRFVALNEVGGDPDVFGASAQEFHRANAERLETFPHGLLATATHDHKRGEDTRARLAVLSEIPEAWERRVRKWLRLDRPRLTDLDGEPAPDAQDRYLFHQTVVGIWPPDGDDPAAVAPALVDRVAAYMLKAVREAKRRSGWAAPDAAYEEALERYVRAALDPERGRAYLADVADLVASIRAPAAVNGLAQTLLKLVSPGVPDVYQGAEFWDFSLVDPDNRRPVDWAARAAALDRPAGAAELLEAWTDGRIKQRVVAGALSVRRADPGLFAAGEYLPLRTEGVHAGRVVALMRRREGRAAIAAVPRLTAPLLAGAPGLLPSRRAWEDTAVLLPDGEDGAGMEDALGGGRLEARDGRVPAADLFARLPVALSVRGG